jgi:hypothetical protein
MAIILFIAQNLFAEETRFDLCMSFSCSPMHSLTCACRFGSCCGSHRRLHVNAHVFAALPANSAGTNVCERSHAVQLWRRRCARQQRRDGIICHVIFVQSSTYRTEQSAAAVLMLKPVSPMITRQRLFKLTIKSCVEKRYLANLQGQ